MFDFTGRVMTTNVVMTRNSLRSLILPNEANYSLVINEIVGMTEHICEERVALISKIRPESPDDTACFNWIYFGNRVWCFGCGRLGL